LQASSPRHRKTSSAKPLAKFRAKGVTPWDKATQYEQSAVRALSQFGLLNVWQLGEWVFKDLATPAARHRQAQALTLRLCPAAQARSRSQRLASDGRRPVLRALGRRRVGNQYYYYLNSQGLRFVRDKHELALPDATKLRTTTVDMAKRGLAFEYTLAAYRADPHSHFLGRAAAAAHAARQHGQASLTLLLLRCLSNLWGSFGSASNVTYIFVADRPGTSNGANYSYYRELAKVTSLQLELAIRIVVIGRRLATEAGCALTETRLAKSVATSKSKASFWSEDGRTYQPKRLTEFFGSLKPHEDAIRTLMERHRA